jgi:NitT/TauT family transport system permease protein
VDLLIVMFVCVLGYALVGVAQEWAGPFRPRTEIDLGLLSLLRYSVFSLVRVFAAYGLSLIFTFTYGYWAAKSKRAEPILISLLDILQSVPVFGFMPGLVLALVNAFPTSNLGLELAAILMVFTCEGWNMVFSFYSSIKGVPQELRDMSNSFRLGRLDVLARVEIPYSMNGLLWNSMLSMAGGWFYIMVMESFTLGEKDFRLPGIGSYMAVAYERGDVGAILAGISTMFFLIIMVDRCLWAPLVVWSERFRYDDSSHDGPGRSVVLDWIRRSSLLGRYRESSTRLIKSLQIRQQNLKEQYVPARFRPERLKKYLPWLQVFVYGGVVLVMIYGIRSMHHLLSQTNVSDWMVHLKDTLITLLRVGAAVVLGSLWTIPVGVFIGTHPVWTRRLQPVVQIVASFPAPMIFPVLTYLMIRFHISIEFGAIALMLLASQWYILFNVISGASLIPQSLMDVAQVFRLKGLSYWKAIILPAIFPSLVNGWITAAGGAWNSCIVSEFVFSGTHTLAATGIGASISEATQNGDFARLAGATVTMITTVVLLNRFFWGSLYRMAETRLRLE